MILFFSGSATAFPHLKFHSVKNLSSRQHFSGYSIFDVGHIYGINVEQLAYRQGTGRTINKEYQT
jgi:hypothetical protein